MDVGMLLIDSMLVRFRGEKKWTLQAIDQLSEDDIVWAPTPESNSIANLLSHIRGTVRQRLETIFYNVRDDRDRDKEFERDLQLSKEQASVFARESFDVMIDVLGDL
ncbi:MAG: DUF1572 family protein [Bacilli bacterium]